MRKGDVSLMKKIFLYIVAAFFLFPVFPQHIITAGLQLGLDGNSAEYNSSDIRDLSSPTIGAVINYDFFPNRKNGFGFSALTAIYSPTSFEITDVETQTHMFADNYPVVYNAELGISYRLMFDKKYLSFTLRPSYRFSVINTSTYVMFGDDDIKIKGKDINTYRNTFGITEEVFFSFHNEHVHHGVFERMTYNCFDDYTNAPWGSGFRSSTGLSMSFGYRVGVAVETKHTKAQLVQWQERQKAEEEAQAIVKPEEEKTDATNIVYNLQSSNTENLFAKTKMWIVDTYRSAKAVIEFEDKDLGVIMGKGMTTDFAPFGYTFKITLKDKNVKVEYYNLTVGTKEYPIYSKGQYDSIKEETDKLTATLLEALNN
jgi:hypothetical protein